MKHYIYTITGSELDPIGTGDARSWFYFYKWPDSGLAFLPVAHARYPLDTGDRLWIFIDDHLVGAVELCDVQVDNEGLPSARQELWYDASQKKDLEQLQFKRWQFYNFHLPAASSGACDLSPLEDAEDIARLESFIAKST